MLHLNKASKHHAMARWKSKNIVPICFSSIMLLILLSWRVKENILYGIVIHFLCWNKLSSSPEILLIFSPFLLNLLNLQPFEFVSPSFAPKKNMHCAHENPSIVKLQVQGKIEEISLFLSYHVLSFIAYAFLKANRT